MNSRDYKLREIDKKQPIALSNSTPQYGRVDEINTTQPKKLDTYQRCPHCHCPLAGNSLGPTGKKIEDNGYCSNCLKALDGSDRKISFSEVLL
jgi:hypothetical protein